MTARRLLLSFAAVVFVSASPSAQPAADPAGHWEGSALVQDMQVPLQLDLAKNADGQYGGTISVPAQKLRGLPLLKVTVDGTRIDFQARSDQPFSGALSPDGSSIAGEMNLGAMSVPVTLTRSGDARFDPAVTSPKISSSLEGTWNGTLQADGGLRLVLTLTNHADGTATGVVTNIDEGGLTIPVTIAESGSTVTIESRVVPGTFSLAFTSEGTELAGTFKQNGAEAPMTFRRAAAK